MGLLGCQNRSCLSSNKWHAIQGLGTRLILYGLQGGRHPFIFFRQAAPRARSVHLQEPEEVSQGSFLGGVVKRELERIEELGVIATVKQPTN